MAWNTFWKHGVYILQRRSVAAKVVEGYSRTPDSSEGLIPKYKAIICHMGIDPYVLFFKQQEWSLRGQN